MCKLKNVALALATIGLLGSGCSTVGDKSLSDKVDHTLQKFESDASQKMAALLSENKYEKVGQASLPFVSTKSIKLSKPLPKEFSKEVLWSFPQGIELVHLVSMITEKTGYQVFVASDVYDIPEGTQKFLDSSKSESSESLDSAAIRTEIPLDAMEFAQDSNIEVPVSQPEPEKLKVFFQANGFESIEKIINKVTSQLAVDWDFDHDERVIKIQRHFTEYFHLAGMLDSEGLLPTSITGGGDGNKSGVSPSASLWESTQKSIVTMLSPGGRVSSNEMSGMIVVTDNKHTLKSVKKYIDQVNAKVTQKVLLNIEVVEFKYVDESNKGIDLSLLNLAGIGQVGLGVDGGGITGGILTPPSGLKNGSWEGSNAIIKALNQRGKVTNKTRKPIYARNNQITSISSNRTVGYLSSTSSTPTANVGTTSSIQVDFIKSGDSVNVLPHIMPDGNSLLLDIGIMISSLNSLDSISSGGQTVQRPDFSENSIMESVEIKNGQTIVLAADEKHSIEKNNSGMLDAAFWWLGGSERRAVEKTSVIYLVTPFISNGIKSGR